MNRYVEPTESLHTVCRVRPHVTRQTETKHRLNLHSHTLEQCHARTHSHGIMRAQQKKHKQFCSPCSMCLCACKLARSRTACSHTFTSTTRAPPDGRSLACLCATMPNAEQCAEFHINDKSTNMFREINVSPKSCSTDISNGNGAALGRRTMR